MSTCRAHWVRNRATDRQRQVGPPYLGAEHGTVSRRDDPGRAAAVHRAEVSREPGVLSGAGGCGRRGAGTFCHAGALCRRTPPISRPYDVVSSPMSCSVLQCTKWRRPTSKAAAAERWQQHVSRPASLSTLGRGTHNTRRCRCRWSGHGSEQMWAADRGAQVLAPGPLPAPNPSQAPPPSSPRLPRHYCRPRNRPTMGESHPRARLKGRGTSPGM